MNFRGSVWENPNHFGNMGSNNNSQFSSPRSGSANNFFNPGNYSNKPKLTPEQVAFENEFTKWESSFAEWKRTYANHPDQSAFREYEKKFLDIRDKLLIKRTRVYGSSNPHSEFEAHLNAASSMAEHLLNFDESPNRQNRFSNQRNNFGQQNNSNRFNNQQNNRGNQFSNQGNPNRFNPYQNSSNNDQRFKKQAGGNINFMRSSSQTSGTSNNQNQNKNQNNLKNKQNNQPQPPQPKKKKTPGIITQMPPMVHTKEDIEQKFAEARQEIAENKCPHFSGASRRKLTRLKERDPSTYDELEKHFMEYAAFVHKERNEFLQRKNGPKADAAAAAVASTDCPMEAEPAATVAPTAEPTATAIKVESQNFALD